MLRTIKQLYGNHLGALDGEIGALEDFYFDDKSWTVRYLVVDTGTWLAGRLVLISPRAVGHLMHAGKVFGTQLTRKQIEESPSIESHKPVSRQFEEEYHRYYGWPYYWQGNALWGASGVPPMVLPQSPPPPEGDRPPPRDDAHLRSAKAVNGYNLKALDGSMGHICDFMMDDQTWKIDQLVIKTGHRFTGKEVQIPSSAVSMIGYDDSTVFVNLTMDSVEHSPGHFEAAMPEVV